MQKWVDPSYFEYNIERIILPPEEKKEYDFNFISRKHEYEDIKHWIKNNGKEWFFRTDILKFLGFTIPTGTLGKVFSKMQKEFIEDGYIIEKEREKARTKWRIYRPYISRKQQKAKIKEWILNNLNKSFTRKEILKELKFNNMPRGTICVLFKDIEKEMLGYKFTEVSKANWMVSKK